MFAGCINKHCAYIQLDAKHRGADVYRTKHAMSIIIMHSIYKTKHAMSIIIMHSRIYTTLINTHKKVKENKKAMHIYISIYVCTHVCL